jgi:hypothetical protein
LHEEVGRRVAELESRHADRLVCRRGCHACCADEITVFEIEASWIRRCHARLVERERPHLPGACAFLDDDGACRIYDCRPYVCRTQGLPLRWIEEDSPGRSVELRDICPLNDLESAPVESLTREDCWTLGPYESRLARIQTDHGGAPPRRVRLRDLFLRSPSVP